MFTQMFTPVKNLVYSKSDKNRQNTPLFTFVYSCLLCESEQTISDYQSVSRLFTCLPHIIVYINKYIYKYIYRAPKQVNTLFFFFFLKSGKQGKQTRNSLILSTLLFTRGVHLFTIWRMFTAKTAHTACKHGFLLLEVVNKNLQSQ